MNQGKHVRRTSFWGLLLLGLLGAALVAGCPSDNNLMEGNQKAQKQTRRRADPPPRVFDDNSPWQGHAAAFTFSSDDNDEANLVWAEVARRHGVRFTIFTVSDWVGWKNKLTWDDLRDLHDDGFEIGGHSVSHPHMPELDDLALAQELDGCRHSLENGMARPDYTCEVFAYPYHEHDARVMAAARRFYRAARDGGQSSQGWPRFSQSSNQWGDVNLFEVPNTITIAALVEANTFSEEETRAGIRGHMGAWKNRHFWVNVYAHNLNDVDAEHFAWILEEVIADGGFWIAPFGEVAQYYREMSED